MTVRGKEAYKLLAALFCGAVVPLGFAPFGWFPVPLLAMCGWMLLLLGATPARAAWYGGLFGLGMFAAGVYWVYISIYLYGNAGLPLALSVTFLFVAFLALYPALAGWLSVRFRARNPLLNLLILFPAFWTLVEWLRGWLFTGFPWLNLGYSQIDSPLAGLAQVTGVYGVSWALLVCAGLLAALVQGRPGQRLFAVAGLLGVLAVSSWLGTVDWTRGSGESFPATIVQGNIAQDLKWRPEEQQATLQRYLDLTAEHTTSKLIVWPETAIPAYYDQVEASFIEPLRRGMAKKDIALVTGIPVLDRREWKYYNAIISLEDRAQYYKKVHLVPFGEYLPLRDALAGILDFLPIPQADFSAGRVDQPLLKAAGYPFGASICYEIAFGEQLIQALPAAAFLINVSNDAWFGDSLAPHQHLEMARMRALEAGRYLLRATNTGISAVIDANGRVVQRSEQFQATAITHLIEPRTGATPYVSSGNWPVIGLSCFIALLAVVVNRKTR